MTWWQQLPFLLAPLLVTGQDARWLPLSVYSDRPLELKASDVRVSCGRQTVSGAKLKAGGGAISVGIVVQGSKAMQENTGHAQLALRRFLQHARAGDEFFTVNSLDAPILGAGFTSEVNALVSSISVPPGKRHSHLLDGITFALDYLGHARNTNRALIVILANDDVASVIKPKELAARLLSAHIPVYVVNLCPRFADDQVPVAFELQKLAQESGGDSWDVSSFAKLGDALARVDVRPQYRLWLSAADSAACAHEQRLKVDWTPGVAHGGVNLRYQRQWPNGLGMQPSRQR
ncbi:hypothetical protein [Paludibaculum fermentans]|uniref:hypothetical protein n=1 Tax=Paludibaculum fermentans TaxID=1473598 RepID=UPI003EB8FA29